MPLAISYPQSNKQNQDSNGGDNLWRKEGSEKGLTWLLHPAAAGWDKATCREGRSWSPAGRGTHSAPWNWMPNFWVAKLKGAISFLQLPESSAPVYGLREMRILNWQTSSQIFKVAIKQHGEKRASVLRSDSTSSQILILYLALICSVWGWLSSSTFPFSKGILKGKIRLRHLKLSYWIYPLDISHRL